MIVRPVIPSLLGPGRIALGTYFDGDFGGVDGDLQSARQSFFNTNSKVLCGKPAMVQSHHGTVKINK